MARDQALEKDALADVVVDTTIKWDVPLMVSRGQSSTTFLYNAAMEARRVYYDRGIKTFVYTLYDHDPGGALRAHPAIAEQLPELAGVPVTVQALAVALAGGVVDRFGLLAKDDVGGTRLGQSEDRQDCGHGGRRRSTSRESGRRIGRQL